MMVLMYGDYRATVMLPPYTPAPAELNPKATHISPSKITTHFGSHSNHFVPHHIQKPSLTPRPSQSQKHPQFRAAEIQKCILGVAFFVRDAATSSESVRTVFSPSSHDTALWWCFAFHPSLRYHLNFLRLLLNPAQVASHRSGRLGGRGREWERVHHPRNAFCVWNYSYYY